MSLFKAGRLAFCNFDKRWLVLTLCLTSYCSIAFSNQNSLVDCGETTSHLTNIVDRDLEAWKLFVNTPSTAYYNNDYLLRVNFLTIADLVKEGLADTFTALALCDDEKNLQALAVYSIEDDIVVHSGKESKALGEGVYIHLLLSAPLGYPGRVKAAGLELLARLFQSLPFVQPLIQLDHTPFSKGFYQKFGFKMAGNFSAYAFDKDFMPAYRRYLSRCSL